MFFVEFWAVIRLGTWKKIIVVKNILVKFVLWLFI